VGPSGGLDGQKISSPLGFFLFKHGFIQCTMTCTIMLHLDENLVLLSYCLFCSDGAQLVIIRPLEPPLS